MLGTFPIVRRHDKAAFGQNGAKAMILAYINALAAGNSDTERGRPNRRFTFAAKPATILQDLSHPYPIAAQWRRRKERYATQRTPHQ